MDGFVQSVLIQIGLYVAVVLFVFVAINVMSSGWLLPWFRTKSSRGKNILVKIRTIAGDYYAIGLIMDGFLVFKSRSGKKRLAIGNQHHGAIYSSMGVKVIDVDDEKNAFVLHDWSKVSGFDAEKFEDLYTRALMKPSLMDKNTQIILIILVLLALGVAFGFYILHGKVVEVQGLVQGIYNLSAPVVQQAVISGGGV